MIFSDVLAYTQGSLKVQKQLSDTRFGGRLEVYLNSIGFVPFCITSFSAKVADLACNQLGYSRAQQYGTVNTLR